MRTLRQDIDGRLRGQWMVIVLLALFPRLAKRKPGYDSPKRVLRRIAVGTAMHFALRQWVEPQTKALAEEREGAQQALRQRLGREPTQDELIEDLIKRRRDG